MPRQETWKRIEGRCETIHTGYIWGGNWKVEWGVEKGLILICSVLEYNLKNDRMISVHYQGKPFNITVIQVYALTSNAEEAEGEWFYEDLQDF